MRYVRTTFDTCNRFRSATPLLTSLFQGTVRFAMAANPQNRV